MLETILTLLAVAVAVALLGIFFWRAATGRSSPCCSSGGDCAACAQQGRGDAAPADDPPCSPRPPERR